MYTVSFGVLRYSPGEFALVPDDETTDILLQINEWCCEVALWLDWAHVGTMIWPHCGAMEP